MVETLARTGGFGVKVTRRRLLETFQHILQVTSDLPSIQPGGAGFASSVRVRLLHAAVRRRILALTREKPSYYDVEAWGIPVNDLDSFGTVSTFSATLIWIGLPRQGIYLTEREKEDYVALWRWVAHVLGTPTEAFESVSRARAMMESLMVSEIEPSDTSRALANNVLSGLCNQPPSYVSRDFLAAETYWLNGANSRARWASRGRRGTTTCWSSGSASSSWSCATPIVCFPGGTRLGTRYEEEVITYHKSLKSSQKLTPT